MLQKDGRVCRITGRDQEDGMGLICYIPSRKNVTASPREKEHTQRERAIA